MIRLAHFSDVHLTVPQLGWQFGDWYSKRLTSWLNHRVFGRARRFSRADDVVTRMMDELSKRAIDHLVFSGDATALGFEAEIGHAAQALRVGRMPTPGLAIPGNHDYCTPSAAASGDFERHFAPWQEGRRIDEQRYPFAQQVGPVWLIGVNAAAGNWSPFDAGGFVDAAQRNRLRQLLAELGPGLKVLVVHFPVCLSNGKREWAHHGLRDMDALLDVANAGGVRLWLHGHRHRPYYLVRPDRAAFSVICAGSAAQNGLWSYGEYTIRDCQLEAVRRVFDPVASCFHDTESFTLQLE